ncbi:CwfJ C-terminus 1-domain-containing protein-like protein [Podospora conica]|nr:CwfJ C-terminus 1-domain-containing protein-like protein [Schizothecium conicum]
MDSLDDFEKSLAAEKAERERAAQKDEERRDRKHKHRHRDRSSDRHREREPRDKDRERDRDRDRGKDRHHRARDEDDDGHRHKRSRRDDDREDDSKHRSRRHRSRDREDRNKEPKHAKKSDPHEDLPLPDDERAKSDPKPQRDSWMTAPSALDVDYVQRGKKSPSPVKEEPQRVLHHRELNRGLGGTAETEQPPQKREVTYTFGDDGSQWRMTKLKSVYTISEQTGRSVDDVAVERFGSLEEFDEAREEKTEMDRRKVYGAGYIGKEKPTGDLFSERKPTTRPEPDSDASPPPEQGLVVQEPVAPVDISTLNRMRAALLRAKLRKDPSAPQLEADYNAAMSTFSPAAPTSSIVLDASHSRLLAGTRAEAKPITNKRGLDRGLVEANDDMSISDMVREERRTRGVAGGEGLRLAERIAKDAKFSSDLEYLDENAEKLARRVHKGETSLKHMAVAEYRRLNAALDRCPLCHHDDRVPPTPAAPVVSLATRVYLTLPPAPELTEGGAVLVPITHRANLLECDDDEWDELRNFMKSLTRMYHDQGRAVVFYENAAAPGRRRHAAMVAVPIPWELGDTAPAFFREAMLSADEEWAQHKKIIDTGKRAREEGLGRMAFRRSLAKEMPYFHVWFTLDGGLGHVVEDEGRWPRGDQFAREIVGGMVDAEPDVIKKEGRWTRGDERVEGWRRRWRKFDWTRVLTEGGEA